MFESKRSFKSVTKECVYGSAIRNGLLFRIYDTPGINSPDQVDPAIDIKRCLYCTSPGFHAIVLVMSGSDRITNEDMKLLKDLDSLLGVSAFKYLILVVSKLENDENDLYRLISESPEMASLNSKCSCRHVIFGNNPKEIPSECIGKFDNILNELVKENARDGNEYFKHRFYDKATQILAKDMDDYMAAHNGVSKEHALEKVREIAMQGKSKRDSELTGLSKKEGCCSIL